MPDFPAARKTDTIFKDTSGPTGAIALPAAGPCMFGPVFIENKLAAHVGCTTPCLGLTPGGTFWHPPLPPTGPAPLILTGSTTVLIHALPAARWFRSHDMTSCDAFLGEHTAAGRTVFIGGESGAPSTDSLPEACAYLHKDGFVSKEHFDRNRAKWHAGQPVGITHTFPGDKKPSNATEIEYEIRGRWIKVIVPDSDKVPPGKVVPKPYEIAQSLATLPDAQLDTIKQVEISPNQNPEDAYWAKEYHKPGFTSAATGGNGGVTYYPSSSWDQRGTDAVMNHEGGHTWAGELWKDPAKKKEWQKAMDKDGRSVSSYADNAIGEDFAESVKMYNVSKNSPCEVFASTLYPNRYAALDKLTQKKP